MSHTGIRVRVNLAGAGTILEADSDWLHMRALEALIGDGEVDVAELLSGSAGSKWHQIMGGPVEIWIQPVELADEYADDEDPGGE